jgi:hypothetical protein
MIGDAKRILDMEERKARLLTTAQSLINEIERGELLLAEISDPKIFDFVKRWSERELSRLARIGMDDIDVDDRDAKLRLQGQYDGVKAFCGSPEFIQNTIDENRVDLEQAHDEVFGINEKLNKLRSKK